MRTCVTARQNAGTLKHVGLRRLDIKCLTQLKISCSCSELIFAPQPCIHTHGSYESPLRLSACPSRSAGGRGAIIEGDSAKRVISCQLWVEGIYLSRQTTCCAFFKLFGLLFTRRVHPIKEERKERGQKETQQDKSSETRTLDGALRLFHNRLAFFRKGVFTISRTTLSQLRTKSQTCVSKNKCC